MELSNILQCSICHDPFTRPKVLPCQHTYCYSCLLSLVGEEKSITCPQCRQVHQLPKTGVQGLPDNLTIKSLLDMQNLTSLAPNLYGETVLCCDCQNAASVSMCDHCEEKLCSKCLVKHAKLVDRIENSLIGLKEFLQSQRRSDEDQNRENLDEIRLEKEKIDQEFEQVQNELEKRRAYFQDYFAMIEMLLQDLTVGEDEDKKVGEACAMDSASIGTGEDNYYTSVESLNSLVCESKTCSSLESLRLRVNDARSAGRLVVKGERFRFVWEGADLGKLARVEAGEGAVRIEGPYGDNFRRNERKPQELTLAAVLVQPNVAHPQPEPQPTSPQKEVLRQQELIWQQIKNPIQGQTPEQPPTKFVDSPEEVGDSRKQTSSKDVQVAVSPAMSAPDVAVQKCDIARVLKTPLRKGDSWFLVDAKWFKQWKKYVDFDNSDTQDAGKNAVYPGVIDNRALLEAGTGELKDHLIEELDYVLLPQEAWDKLFSWYALTDHQEPIQRYVIEQGMFVKQCKVEVYLMDLKLARSSDMENQTVIRQFSRSDTISQVETKMRELFNIPEDEEVRLWSKYMTNTYELLDRPENTLQDEGLYQGQWVVIEQRNEDGSWPRQTKSTAASRHSSSSTYRSGSALGSSSSNNNYNGRANLTPGMCGLNNPGNTCFMNSAIQVMISVPELTEYFIDQKWVDELNEENLLGRGEIARAYAELIQYIWSGTYSSTEPENFKLAVNSVKPQLGPNPQELITFLLGALHADLNRIKRAPHVESKDPNGRLDEVVARESWLNFKKQNDSIITDTFYGQLKSTLVCPQCDKVSVTFDPMCYLSLDIAKKERQMDVVFMPIDPEKKPTQYKLTVPKSGCVGDLCLALSWKVAAPPNRMVVVDVYNHRFHRIFTSEEGVTHILDRDDIFIYELQTSLADEEDYVLLPVYLRERKVRRASTVVNSARPFGTPLLLTVPKRTCTYQSLRNMLLQRMSRYVRLPETDDWWKEEGVEDKQYVSEDEEGDDEELTRFERRIFTLAPTNQYGCSGLDKLIDEERVIRLNSKSHLAVDWNSKAKKMFFDERESELIGVDDSMHSRAGEQSVQLQDCLDLFTKKRRLGADDPWHCPECKNPQQAHKKLDLWQLPNVLVIYLNRFSHDRPIRDKRAVLVEFPVRNLNMKRWVQNPQAPAISSTYDLLGVVNHYYIGPGGVGDHFTAFAKNKDDRKWYKFDDSSVSAAGEADLCTSAACVLVYQRRPPERKIRKATRRR